MPSTQTLDITPAPWSWDTRIELTPKGKTAAQFLKASDRLFALRHTDDATAFLNAAKEKARTAAAMWDQGLTLLDVTPLPTDACETCGETFCLCSEEGEGDR